MIRRLRPHWVPILLCASCLPLPAQESAAPSVSAPPAPIHSSATRFHPVLGRGGMAVSQEALATRSGVEVLRRGGNAVDAAVTMGFALAVTLPRAGNLGGGGFMLLHLAESGETAAIDYREIAPTGSHRDLFLGPGGVPDPQKSRSGPFSTGVPGTVRGLCETLQRYGTISLAEALAPAIRLAREGFPVSVDLSRSLAHYRAQLKASPAAFAAFYRPDGSNHEPGDILRQPDLAATLERIATGGPPAFYEGETAALLVEDLQARGATMTREDLAGYQARFRAPVATDYRGHEVITMPPPSSGAVILSMLNILERLPLNLKAQHAAESFRQLAEVMKFGFADRAEFIGDPDFVSVPLDVLLDKPRAWQWAERIRGGSVIPSSRIGNPDLTPAPAESPETTHFSVMDAKGNAVANTYTLNFTYGSRYMVPGTGFLLNNEMDDFSAKPGSPNAFGLLGAEANAVAEGKRMASSMSPTIVMKEGRPWLLTGSPGGSRILSSVLQILVNVIDHEMNLAGATSAPRIHHQWLPDRLELEPGVSEDTAAVLREMGYDVRSRSAMGSTQSILTRDGIWFEGAADPRRPGALALPVVE